MNFEEIKNIIHLDTVSVIALNHLEDSRVSRSAWVRTKQQILKGKWPTSMDKVYYGEAQNAMLHVTLESDEESERESDRGARVGRV